MSGEGRGPDFSTPFWKEFRLRYPRPAVYIPVGAAYLLAGGGLLAVDLRDAPPFTWGLMLLFLAVLSLLPALIVARRFSSRRALLALRERLAAASDAERARLQRLWCRRELLGAAAPFGLALLLLLPVYLCCGTLTADWPRERFGSGVRLGAALWLDVGAAALLAAVLGAALALPARMRRPGLVACAMMLLAGALRVVLFFQLVEEGLYPPLPGIPERFLLTALLDALTCLLLAVGLMALLPRLLARRLARPEPEYASDEEVMADAPEGMGLGISFWALFKWRFWLDPFYRAEKRSLWSRRRLIILWAAFALGGLGTLMLVPFWVSMAWGKSPLQLTGVPLGRLLVLAVPAIMAVGLSAEKRNGALESVLLTPAAPLRLAAAKLVGRCLPLLLAGLAAVLLSAFVVLLAGSFGWAQLRSRNLSAFMFATLREFTLVLPLMLACGAAGLYSAARHRTLLGALVVAYAFVAPLLLILDLWFFAVLEEASRGWRGWGSRYSCLGRSSMSYWLILACLLHPLILGLMLRVFLVGAARQMVLRRGEQA